MIQPPKKVFPNNKMKVNSRTWMTLKSSVVIFLGPRTSAASFTWSTPATSLTSTASKTLFHQKTSCSKWLVHPWHQNVQYWPLFVKWIIKNPIFTDIWYFFWLRLLRPADVIFLKNGCGTQKFPISAFQNHLQIQFNLHILIRQSQFISAISIWDTLYLLF